MLLSNFFPIFFLTFKNFMTNGSPMNECGLWNNFFFLIRLLFSLNHFWDKHNPCQLNKVKIQSVAWPKLKEVEGCLIFHIIFLNQPGFWGNSWFYINIKIYEFFSGWKSLRVTSAKNDSFLKMLSLRHYLIIFFISAKSHFPFLQYSIFYILNHSIISKALWWALAILDHHLVIKFGQLIDIVMVKQFSKFFERFGDLKD